MRGEKTWADGRLFTIDGLNDKTIRSVILIFSFYKLELSDCRRTGFVYRLWGRIDRPAYQDLNPFEYLLDELSYWKGNPFLMPQKRIVSLVI